MDVHQNARLTPKGRETMVRAVVDNGASASEVARRFHTTVKNGQQMGQAVPDRRPGRLAGPFLAAPFNAEPDAACHLRYH